MSMISRTNFFCRGTLWRYKLSHYVFKVSQENRVTPPPPNCPVAPAFRALKDLERGLSGGGVALEVPS